MAHNNEYVKRSSFYGNAPDPAYVKFVMNQDPSTVKNFLTLNYEGTSGWYASELNFSITSLSPSLIL